MDTRTIVDQQIKYDGENISLVTKFSDDIIMSEPMTSEEAAQWQAEHKY